MEILISQCTRLQIGLGNAENESTVTKFHDSTAIFDRLDAARILWSDGGIRTTFQRKGEYSTLHPLQVSTEYFMDHLDRITERSYLPITEDIVRVRKQTKGVIQYEFVVTDIQFKITDVGGDREERDRWINFLQTKITCVIFIGAIDEYDTMFHENNDDGAEKNRLSESIELFAAIQNYSWLDHTTFILFMNKVDVFQEKIQNSNIGDFFPDYTGFPKDAETGKAFIRKKFLERNAQRRTSRMIYTHDTCATNTEGMRFVFEAVKDTILQLNLRQYNLV